MFLSREAYRSSCVTATMTLVLQFQCYVVPTTEADVLLHMYVTTSRVITIIWCLYV